MERQKKSTAFENKGLQNLELWYMKKMKVIVVTGFEPAYPDSVGLVGALSIKLHDLLCSTAGLEFHIKRI